MRQVCYSRIAALAYCRTMLAPSTIWDGHRLFPCRAVTSASLFPSMEVLEENLTIIHPIIVLFTHLLV